LLSGATWKKAMAQLLTHVVKEKEKKILCDHHSDAATSSLGIPSGGRADSLQNAGERERANSHPGNGATQCGGTGNPQGSSQCEKKLLLGTDSASRNKKKALKETLRQRKKRAVNGERHSKKRNLTRSTTCSKEAEKFWTTICVWWGERPPVQEHHLAGRKEIKSKCGDFKFEEVSEKTYYSKQELAPGANSIQRRRYGGIPIVGGKKSMDSGGGFKRGKRATRKEGGYCLHGNMGVIIHSQQSVGCGSC